jgi:multidrug efflux pump
VTGMIVGTLFTLFVVPVFYLLIAAQHRPEEVTEEETDELPRPRPSLVEA